MATSSQTSLRQRIVPPRSAARSSPAPSVPRAQGALGRVGVSAATHARRSPIPGSSTHVSSDRNKTNLETPLSQRHQFCQLDAQYADLTKARNSDRRLQMELEGETKVLDSLVYQAIVQVGAAKQAYENETEDLKDFDGMSMETARAEQRRREEEAHTERLAEAWCALGPYDQKLDVEHAEASQLSIDAAPLVHEWQQRANAAERARWATSQDFLDYMKSDSGLSSEAVSIFHRRRELEQKRSQAREEIQITELDRRVWYGRHEELKGTIRVYVRVKGQLSEPSPVFVAEEDRPSGAKTRHTGSLRSSSAPSTRPSSISRPRGTGADCRSSSSSSSSCAQGVTTMTTGKLRFPDADNTKCKIAVVQSRENATSTGMREHIAVHTYDRVFPPSSAQSDIFHEVGPLVDCAVDGQRICILAYGQTGSGKTYTMEGDLHDDGRMGIVPRGVRRIFERCRSLAADGWSYEVSCYYIEIYNDQIRDLLEPSDAYHRSFFPSNGSEMVIPLKSHDIQHVDRADTVVTNVTERVVRSAEDVFPLLDLASRNRSVAKTAMNEHSSRSHCIFTLRIRGSHRKLQHDCLGHLCLVDLAGSERVNESKVQGQQRKEAVNINLSLSYLTKCIHAMWARSVVSWRDCKLTYLLQNYISGDGAKVLMVVNISDRDEHIPETQNSLRIADQACQTPVAAGASAPTTKTAAVSGVSIRRRETPQPADLRMLRRK